MKSRQKQSRKNETHIPEVFLHYLWRLKNFDLSKLTTTEGEEMIILQSGFSNSDSGPDFQEAKIRIGRTLWAGSVEIHTLSSDWLRHAHQHDPAYDKVILHVVFREDQIIYNRNQIRIPCLELESRIDASILNEMWSLYQSRDWIPCAPSIEQVPKLTIDAWLERLLVERLIEKTKRIEQELERTRNDWQESFYRMLAYNFGFLKNSIPFIQLARSLPLKLLLRHKDKPVQIEALLFGQAGLLNQDFKDEYPQKLKKEYLFLQNKYRLAPIPAHHWKFMRLRPANFPTIRIAQFANLWFKTEYLFNKILAVKTVTEMENLFNVKVSWYWKTHYRFDEASTSKSKRLGKSSIQLLLINTVIPFLFQYGRYFRMKDLEDKAMRLLSECPPETNMIIRRWKKLNVPCENAFHSQALLFLKAGYCDKRKCLSCSIGNHLIQHSSSDQGKRPAPQK